MSTVPVERPRVVTKAEFLAHAAEWLSRINDASPIEIVEEDGSAVGVLVSPEGDGLSDADRERLHASVMRGLADVEAGRVTDHATVKAQMQELLARLEAR